MFQVYLSNTNNLHTVVWFKVSLSTSNNFQADNILIYSRPSFKIDAWTVPADFSERESERD